MTLDWFYDSPSPPKPAIFFHERFMAAARHEERRHEDISSKYLVVCEGLSNDDVGLARGPLFLETVRPGACFKTSDFVEENLGGGGGVEGGGYHRRRTTHFRRLWVNPFRAPEPLPILNPSNFVPKNGFPVEKGLRSPVIPKIFVGTKHTTPTFRTRLLLHTTPFYRLLTAKSICLTQFLFLFPRHAANM